MLKPLKTCTCCGREFQTALEWLGQTVYVGHQESEDEKGRFKLHLRACGTCGSTIAVPERFSQADERAIRARILALEDIAAQARALLEQLRPMEQALQSQLQARDELEKLLQMLDDGTWEEKYLSQLEPPENNS
ncbi:MAG: hypothetical protein ACK4N5_05810 [Myxococcales bacterium]